MSNSLRRFSYSHKSCLGIFSILLCLGMVQGIWGMAQEADSTKNQDPPKPMRNNPETPKQDTSPTNSTTPPEKPTLKRIPGYPPVEQRVSDYLRLANSGKTPREESRPYVIEGVSVVGISGTESAFLRTEDGKTIIVRKGMRMYNGTVVAIQRDRVVFRQGNSKKLIEKLYGQNINAKAEDDGDAQ